LSDPELEKILSEKLKRLEADLAQSGQFNSIIKLTENTFDQYTNEQKPLFVDFWAEWCGPCRIMEPIVEKLATKYAGKLIVGKLNVDEESNLATRYDVYSIPTFMIFKNGQPVDALIGAVGESTLNQLIQKALSGSNIHS
jgi:thioredoxin 1